MLLINLNGALAAQGNTQRSLQLIVVRAGYPLLQRQLGHGVALGFHHIAAAQIVVDQLFVIVKGHLHAKAVLGACIQVEFHRLAGRRGNGALSGLLPCGAVQLIGRIGIAYRTAVGVGHHRAENLEGAGGAVIVRARLFLLIKGRDPLQGDDLQLLLGQQLHAAGGFHIHPGNVARIGGQPVKGHLTCAVDAQFLRAGIACSVGDGCRGKALVLLRGKQVGGRFCNIPRTACYLAGNGDAVLGRFFVRQNNTGGIGVEHPADKFTGIDHVGLVGRLVVGHDRKLIGRIGLQRAAVGEKAYGLAAVIEVEARRGLMLIGNLVAGDHLAGLNIGDGYRAGVSGLSVLYIANCLQGAAVILDIDNTGKPRCGYIPLPDGHGGQGAVGGAFHQRILTGRTGAAVFPVRAAGAVAALLPGFSLFPVLAVPAVLTVYCGYVQLGHDLAAGLQLGKHNGVIGRHRKLCGGKLVCTVIDELRHRVNTNAARRFDIAVLGNGHPQVFGGQQVDDAILGDDHLDIIADLPHVLLRKADLERWGLDHVFPVGKLPHILAELHRTGSRLGRVGTVGIGKAQAGADVVVIDEVLGKVVKIQQYAVAQRHDAVILKMDKALLRYRSLFALGIGKADLPGQRGGIALPRPERHPFYLLGIPLKDIPGGIKGRRVAG